LQGLDLLFVCHVSVVELKVVQVRKVVRFNEVEEGP
jgi:hypothetical protein